MDDTKICGPQFWYTEIAFMVRFTIPSGKHTKNYGKSQFFMGKLTISMAIFNSDVKLPEGNLWQQPVADFVGVRGKEEPFRARKHRLRANVRICARHFRKPPCGHINSKTEGHINPSHPAFLPSCCSSYCRTAPGRCGQNDNEIVGKLCLTPFKTIKQWICST